MKIKKLKRSHVKRSIIIGVGAVLIISAVILNFTRAKYRVTQSIPLVNGTINYSLPDLNIIGLYIDGEEATKLDSSKTYTLDTTQSTCTYKDGSAIDNLDISYESETGKLTITLFTTKGTKCALYFEEFTSSIKDTLLVNYPTVLTRTDFSTTVTETTTGTIYKSANSSQYDNDGEVYYFAGNPTDNWVKFGGFYWRIIRINGNGSLRLIYQGTSANTTGEGTQIGESAFNPYGNDNAYVGYMYGIDGASTYKETHKNTNDSIIKKDLDTWYQQNLLNKYGSYIDGNTGFCNDRQPSTNTSETNGLGGYGREETYYAGNIRFEEKNLPTFKCSSENDLFTDNNSSHGNKALTYPIGLITGDEIVFAGTISNLYEDKHLTVKTYLNTETYYYTLTPGEVFPSNLTTMYIMQEYGTIHYYNGGTDMEFGVRPVINLRSDVTISSGNGTATNPYIVN